MIKDCTLLILTAIKNKNFTQICYHNINFKLLKFGIDENKNVEVDGDYLINGMYL